MLLTALLTLVTEVNKCLVNYLVSMQTQKVAISDPSPCYI